MQWECIVEAAPMSYNYQIASTGTTGEAKDNCFKVLRKTFRFGYFAKNKQEEFRKISRKVNDGGCNRGR